MSRKSNQKHGFPALLSFFLPGLGQLIKGDILKAILIWLVASISYAFFIVVWPVSFLCWSWNLYDAYNAN